MPTSPDEVWWGWEAVNELVEMADGIRRQVVEAAHAASRTPLTATQIKTGSRSPNYRTLEVATQEGGRIVLHIELNDYRFDIGSITIFRPQQKENAA